jgi:hypothetical protein
MPLARHTRGYYLLIYPLIYTAGKERGTFKGMDALIT